MKRVTRGAGAVRLSDSWRTPGACFEALHDEFAFDIDLAADPTNALAPQWLGPGSAVGEDAFLVRWHGVGRVGFLNPPYSDIAPWVNRANQEASRGFTTVALLPFSPDTRWWSVLELAAAEVRRIPHRVPYLRADGVKKAGAMFPSCVAVIRPQPGVVRPAAPRWVTWTWRRNEEELFT